MSRALTVEGLASLPEGTLVWSYNPEISEAPIKGTVGKNTGLGLTRWIHVGCGVSFSTSFTAWFLNYWDAYAHMCRCKKIET